MPTFTVHAERVDIVKLEATIEAGDSNKAWQIAEGLDDTLFDYVDTDSPEGIEITGVVEQKGK